MKDYFIRLFDYDRFANHLIAETIIKANNNGKAIEIMAHLLTVQQIWLGRCKGEPATGGSTWPDWKADTFEQMIDDNHRAWINYLDYLSPDDFDKPISYINFKGDSFQNKLSDILTQVTNHGTHHRGQVGQQLKFDGVGNLPVTDYIMYIWKKNN